MSAEALAELDPSIGLALGSEDHPIDTLADGERATVGAVWLHRAESELTAAVAFADLCRDLAADGALPDVVRLAARATMDEARHAEICRLVTVRYLRAAPGRPTPRPYQPPRFGNCPEALNRTLRLVLQSCISETIGSAYLKACLDATSGAVARVALHELLRDEIDHARIGYMHLASGVMGSAHLEHVRMATPTLIEFARSAWRAEDAGAPVAVPAGHGCLDRQQMLEAVADAIDNLVSPGIELAIEHGLEAARNRRSSNWRN